MPVDGLLHRDRAPDCVGRAGEGRHDAVAQTLDDVTAVGNYGVPEQLVVEGS